MNININGISIIEKIEDRKLMTLFIKELFDYDNFNSIEDECRLSFWLCSNNIVNNSSLGLKAKENFPEEGLPAGSYSLTVTVEGKPTSTMILNLSKNTSVKQLKNKILFSLDPVVYPFEINSSNNEKDLIILQSSTEGKTIKITDGLDGINLLDYFDVVEADYGTAPNQTNKILDFFNLSIEHFRNLEKGNSKSYLRFILDGKEKQIIESPWNNNAINAPNFISYLNFLTNNSEDKKTLLLQFIGVCISNIKGYRLKKALFLVGDGNTGKSQLKSLIEKILYLCKNNYKAR